METKKSFTMKLSLDDLKRKLRGNQDMINLTENEVFEYAIIFAGIFIATLAYLHPALSATATGMRTSLALAWEPLLIKVIKKDAARLSLMINEMEGAGEEILYLHMLCKEVDKSGRGYSVPTFDVIEEYYDFNEYSRYD